MKKVLSILGVAFLAQMLFVGMIHFLLLVQGNSNPDTVRSLSDMPVIGGFFFPPAAAEEPLSESEIADIESRRRLEESRRFFPPPEGLTREELEELRKELLGERDAYRRRTDAFGAREEALDRLGAELESEKALLAQTLQDLNNQATQIEAQREELSQRLISLDEDEARNLTVMKDVLSSMQAENASKILREQDVKVAAMILTLMEGRTAGKILDAWQDGPDGSTVSAVEVTAAMRNITSGGGDGR